MVNYEYDLFLTNNRFIIGSLKEVSSFRNLPHYSIKLVIVFRPYPIDKQPALIRRL
jgi:hypothetical protein